MVRDTRRNPLSFSLIRTLVILAVLLICVWLIAAHGIRGLGVVAVIAVLVTVPQTRAYRFVERGLIRFTGSRKRALLLVMSLAIAVLVVVNVLEFTR